ncbi:SRPBCC family protein [Pelagibacterium lacus]|uniref:SRPBCC domain-containing protein n=1 Tax=Pelagibacterium lacus TaxID=2282655 RepID=A0A369W2K2_9HYPH|nr:SRPBCC domain-containing protein [Pelagibacterium lacus]RDE08906.1 SRPBCC domain-containing protein [Pelagibacterium lacus]
MSNNHSVSIVRTFEAPAEDVYAAWTDPDRLGTWVGQVERADVRVGGSYRFVNDDGEGGTFVHEGRYLELIADRKIVMTFGAAQIAPQDNPYTNETITIQLRPLDANRTELTFTNAWEGEAMDDEGIEATRQGWTAWLDLLAEALA